MLCFSLDMKTIQWCGEEAMPVPGLKSKSWMRLQFTSDGCTKGQGAAHGVFETGL